MGQPAKYSWLAFLLKTQTSPFFPYLSNWIIVTHAAVNNLTFHETAFLCRQKVRKSGPGIGTPTFGSFQFLVLCFFKENIGQFDSLSLSYLHIKLDQCDG